MRSTLDLGEIRDLKDLARTVNEGEVRSVVVGRGSKKKDRVAPELIDRTEKKPSIPVHLLQVPVTRSDAELNRDDSSLNVGRDRVITLSLAEIEQAPYSRKSELLRRFRGYLNLVAGSAVGSIESARPEKFSAEKGDAKLSIDGTTITAQRGEKSVTIDLAAERSRWPYNAVETVLAAFDVLLVDKNEERSSLNREVAGVYLSLLGPAGALTDKSDAPAPFKKAHLIAYDLNGTVDHRSGIGQVSGWLSKMGASSVITTSVGAQSGESAMKSQNAPFDAFFGGDAVRPGGGSNKSYRGIASAFGISEEQAKHQLIVVGDSGTDEPADLKGVIFLNDTNRTPAEALLLLYRALDDAGNGSFADGLQALTGGKSGEVKAGPVAFSVSYNDRGPVIRGLHIQLGVNDLLKALGEQAPNDPEKRAVHQLAMTALGSVSGEAVDALMNTTARTSPTFVRRVAALALESVAQQPGYGKLAQAKQAASSAVSETALVDSFTAVAKETTASSIAELESLSRQLPELNRSAKERALAGAAQFAKYVKLLAEFGATGEKIPADYEAGSAISIQGQARRIDLEQIAQNGLPADLRDQEALVRELRSVLSRGAFSEKQTLAKIADRANDTWSLRSKIEQLFTRREEKFGAIREIVSTTSGQIAEAKRLADEQAKQRAAELEQERPVVASSQFRPAVLGEYVLPESPGVHVEEAKAPKKKKKNWFVRLFTWDE